MISVMSNSSCDLDRREDFIDEERRAAPGVSGFGEAGVVNSSDMVDVGRVSAVRGPDEVRDWEGDARDRSGDAISVDVGDEQVSLGFGEVKGTIVPVELDNRAGVLDAGVNSEVHGGSEVWIVDNIASERMEHCGGRNNITGKEIVSSVPTADAQIGVRFSNSENSESRVEKRDVIRRPTISHYDSMFSMFDELAENGRRGSVGSRLIGYGYEIGDMVWGKVKSHPWWPGHIFNDAFALPAVRRTKREGHVLVAFFGDSSYGWFDAAELIPFESNFSEKSKQINSRPFMKAVEEAVDEVSRRSELGLACRCRNPYNFRPTNVQGFYSVDLGDYEPGGVYSVGQINKARDSFRPRETLSFIRRMCLAIGRSDYGSIQFIKSKATVLAYRKSVFEEFDETYAQAFGVQPVRPQKATGQGASTVTSIALSGPLVFAEDLGKRKNSTKPYKVKDEVKKDRYLFKRRDESNESRSHQSSQGQVNSLVHSAYSVVSSKFENTAKHEEMDIIARNTTIHTNQDMKSEVMASTVLNSGASCGINEAKLESSVSFSADQTRVYNIPLKEGKSSSDITKIGTQEVKGVNSTLEIGPYIDSSSVLEKLEYQREGNNLPPIYQQSSAGESQQSSGQQVTCEALGVSRKGYDNQGRMQSIGTSGKTGPGDDSNMRIESGTKKAKVHKRPVGEVSPNSALVEKKKRKKEATLQMHSNNLHRQMEVGRLGLTMGKMAGKPVQILPSNGESQGHCPMEVDRLTQQMIGTENNELDVSGLLVDLHAFALDPFNGLESRGLPTMMMQGILRFRSLVFQKSLASLAQAENDSNEISIIKSSAVSVTPSSISADGARELSSKPSRPSPRLDDPTKSGRVRGPSDRQEDMAVKKMKKINDIKSLKVEKKSVQKAGEGQRDRKDAVAPSKGSKLEYNKKPVPLSRVPEPTMLVMKFPPQGTLPSIPELKARFARFGPLDHSATRAFWKSLTCRVLFQYKANAQAAYKYALGTKNLFGNANVRCFLRDLGTPEPEPVKVKREDAAMGIPKLKETPGEQQRPQQQQQSITQLKSCLKKSSGDEGGVVTSGARGTPRVKFMLGGEDSGRKEQVEVGNKNSDASSFADGGTSTSSHAMDFNGKNIQNIIPPSTSTSSSSSSTPSSSTPSLSTPSSSTPSSSTPSSSTPSSSTPLSSSYKPPSLYPKAPNNFPYTEVVPGNGHNLNNQTTLGTPNVDISQQMMSLLNKCNDIVASVSGYLGYVPYHSL